MSEQETEQGGTQPEAEQAETQQGDDTSTQGDGQGDDQSGQESDAPEHGSGGGAV